MSKRLLLADDSVTIQKVIGITFANEDYQLDIVDNGDSAFEHAQAQLPDLVLADVYMPGKNGYELCAAIKQDPELASVPVMLLTGTFEPFDEDKARQAGADTWISKPFESQYLIDQVEELLAKVEAAVAAPASSEPAPLETATAEAPAAGSWSEVALEDDDLLEAAAEEPQEDVANDDIWGAVSLDEDDLLLEDDLADSLADAESAPPEVAEVAEPVGEDDAWGEVDDEIFDLEDGDIIDEADLLEEVEEAEEVVEVSAAEVADTESFASADELPEEEPLETEAAETGSWSIPGVELPELEQEPLPVEPEPVELAASVESEPVVEPAFEMPVAAESIVAAEAEAAAPREVTLDEAQVAQIVERVATEVVERLAENLLERVAWEVVPDLAESLIKDEIRKIKSNLQ